MIIQAEDLRLISVLSLLLASRHRLRRPGLESMSDRVTLTDYEARRLLNAIVKEFVQMTAEELEQQATEGNRYADDEMISSSC